MKLSVIIPVYSESPTIEEILARVQAVDLSVEIRDGQCTFFRSETSNLTTVRSEKEILVVDDGSTNGTQEILVQQANYDSVQVFFHQSNRGKGTAIRTAIKQATGDIILIQDADLEYDPRDYPELLRPVLEGRAEVVYSSRFLGGHRKAMLFWHMIGNKLLTLITNILYNTTLSDIETCYKVFRADVIRALPLRARRFEFEPEVTAKLLKRGYRIYEVPISYTGREYTQGKKITWRDGITAL